MLRRKCRSLQDADYNFNRIAWALTGHLDDANIRSLSVDRIEAGEISSDFVFAGRLEGATGTFTGDVTVGGKLMVGEHGVVSIFQYTSFGTVSGWGEMGIAQLGGEISVKKVPVSVFIPENFRVEKAIIRIESMPVFYYDEFFGGTTWKQARNLKLYKTDGLDGHMLWIKDAGVQDPFWVDGLDITQVVLPVTGVWNPYLAYSGDNRDTGILENKIQVIEGDIKEYLENNKLLVFYVETTDLPLQVNFDANQSMGRVLITIEGYATI